ncbi:MAG: SUMF1/EgtB/PvdO family nonheme iron enzyme [Microcoleaceae cyanobacterium]
MAKTYYTFRIQLANDQLVQVKKWDNQHQSRGEPSRPCRYREKREQIASLLQPVLTNQLNNYKQAQKLGEVLFEAIFDDVLCHELINFYQEAVRNKKQLLRIELDIDEQTMPEVAALPWEFMCLPASANVGNRWLGTDPNIVFSRRRALWHSASPIQLEKGEKLRIALAIAAPQDLGHVEYEQVKEALENLAKDQPEKIELLPILNPATATAIDNLLEQKPHIFHFIGHGQMQHEAGDEVGQIALVKKVFNTASWINAGAFSELFNRWSPGVVLLQACESGMLSASRAFAGAASKIVNMNISVVVAMQYEVSNMTASQFAYEFYQRLAKGEPVDVAAQNGRRTIGLETQHRKRDFATPVIFMRVQDGYLFKRENKERSNETVGFYNSSQLTTKEEKSPIAYTLSPNINRVEEPQNTQLIIPSVPGTQTFEFTTVIIDAHGKEISRSQSQNHFLIEDLGNGVMLKMVVIPGGEFLMGSPDSEGSRYSNERPQHSVTIKPFLISKYPITKAQWREVACLPEVHRKLKLLPSRLGGKSHPVTKVSWYDAVEFCDRLSRKTAQQYRLPSEAEWEYACRARTTTPFHFGETITTSLANFDGRYPYASEYQGIYLKKTTPVDHFNIANNFGLFDMHGNVLEWCLDHWHNNYENAPTDGNEWLDNSEHENRVKRGGSWRNEPLLCRSSSRKPDNASKQAPNIGFRIVCSL